MPAPLVSPAGPSWRAVLVVVIGLLAGFVVAPAARAPVAASDVAASSAARWASCPSVAFYPSDSDDPYGVFDIGRTGASVRMYCGLTLPDRATITLVRFHLYDGADRPGEISDCEVGRIRVDVAGGGYQTMARPPSSGPEFHDGYVTVSDASIAHAVVDDRSFAYLAQCQIPANVQGLRIIGATIRYQPA